MSCQDHKNHQDHGPWTLSGLRQTCLLEQVAIVRDEVAAISAEVRAAAPNHEVVLTAGGLGPTCDDVTMAGIADALGKPLERQVPDRCAAHGHQHNAHTV